MLVNHKTKAAKLLAGVGADPLFENVAAEVEKRGELITDADGRQVYELTDRSQIELVPSLRIARVVKNA